MPGFRVAISLQGFAGSVSHQKKCLVYLEEKWTKVADFEAHLKKVFQVKRVEVFIDDCWVSSEEPICIFKPSDTISVREVECLPKQSTNSLKHEYEESSPERKEKRPKKKKKLDSPVQTAEEPEVDDALEAKKQELLMKVKLAVSPEEMDITDSSLPAKKRRHRKRPSKKRQERLERLSVGSALMALTQPDEAPPVENYSRPADSRHIVFESDEDDKDENPVGVVETAQEEWQQRLLALTQERKKPVFVRNEVVNGETSRSANQNGNGTTNGCARLNGDTPANGFDDCPRDHQTYVNCSVATETVKANDVLYFKKLNIVSGQPQVSDQLLALVEEVDELGAVVLKVFEGNSELSFSPDEIQDSEDGCFIVKIDWRHVFEPRLIVDSSLLSKFL